MAEESFRQVAQVMAEFREASVRAGAALAPLAEEIRRVLALPAVQALLEAEQAGELKPLVRERGCYCLCERHHPDRRVCEGLVPEAEMRAVAFVSKRLGRVAVWMCVSCAGAVVEAAGR